MRDHSKPASCAYGCCPSLPGPNGEHGDCCGPPGVLGPTGCCGEREDCAACPEFRGERPGTQARRSRAEDDGPEYAPLHEGQDNGLQRRVDLQQAVKADFPQDYTPFKVDVKAADFWRTGEWTATDLKEDDTPIPVEENTLTSWGLMWEVTPEQIEVNIEVAGSRAILQIPLKDLQQALRGLGPVLLLNDNKKAYFVWPEQYAIVQATDGLDQKWLEAWAESGESVMGPLAKAILAWRQEKDAPKTLPSR